MNLVPYLISEEQDRKNNEIVRQVLIEEAKYNNASGSITSGEVIVSICKKVDPAQKGKFDTCVDQMDGTEKTAYDNATTQKYWKAVSKGYKGTIAEYAKKQETISKGLGLAVKAGGFASGLFTKTSNQDMANTPVVTPNTSAPKPNISLKTILFVSAGVIAIGAAVMFVVIKSQKN